MTKKGSSMELCCEKTDSQNLGQHLLCNFLMYVCESCQVSLLLIPKERKILGSSVHVNRKWYLAGSILENNWNYCFVYHKAPRLRVKGILQKKKFSGLSVRYLTGTVLLFFVNEEKKGGAHLMKLAFLEEKNK